MTDGCTLWFDGVWGHCCNAHDLAYSAQLDKLQADLDLAFCVAETGNPVIAAVMFIGVSVFGWIWYRRGKR